MIALALLLAGSAQAQIVPIPQFTGTWTETWDSSPDAACLDVVGGTVGTVCSINMLASVGWQNQCFVNPYAGAQFVGSSSGAATYTFVTPIRRFGGWFNTHNDSGSGFSATITFFDITGTPIGQAVEPLSNCNWVWFGWESLSDDVWSIEVFGGTSGGFVLMDETEFSDVGSPDVDGDGYTVLDGDCDDDDPATFPGATEACDGVDNDCDGTVPLDELDADGDGVLGCNDCDDVNPFRYPGNIESCDGVDNDCDDIVPFDELDSDGDGFRACEGDCDDYVPEVFPGNAEVCDGYDNDCDGTLPADELDTDGDGFTLCEGDCDDTLPAVNPDGIEIAGDGIDQDCDGSDLVDGPGDGLDTGSGSDKEGGCGCTTATGTMPVLAWLPLVLVLARRRV